MRMPRIAGLKIQLAPGLMRRRSPWGRSISRASDILADGPTCTTVLNMPLASQIRLVETLYIRTIGLSSERIALYWKLLIGSRRPEELVEAMNLAFQKDQR